MEAREQFFHGGGESWSAGYDAMSPANTNIDPLLGSIMSTHNTMNPSHVFNPHQPASIGPFDPNIQSAPVSGIMLANLPSSSHDTRSSSLTIFTHSDMARSPTESRRSSLLSSPWTGTENSPKSRISSQQTTRPKPIRRSYTSPSIRGSSRQPMIAPEPSHDGGENNGDEEAKRGEFLRRNRLAASRCRQKKKQWVHQLEETSDELEQQNIHLQMERKSLIAEIGQMKQYIMAHAVCNDTNIDRWIEMEARRIVEKSRQQYDDNDTHVRQPSSRCQDRPQRPGQTPTRSNSTKSSDAGITYGHTSDSIFDSISQELDEPEILS